MMKSPVEVEQVRLGSADEARRNVRRRNRPLRGGANGRSKNRGNTRRHWKTYGDKAHIIALFDEAVMEGVAAAASCIDKSMKLSCGECMRYIRKRRHILELAAHSFSHAQNHKFVLSA